MKNIIDIIDNRDQLVNKLNNMWSHEMTGFVLNKGRSDGTYHLCFKSPQGEIKKIAEFIIGTNLNCFMVEKFNTKMSDDSIKDVISLIQKKIKDLDKITKNPDIDMTKKPSLFYR